MVELQHRAIDPAELIAFRATCPTATPADFDSLAFRPSKLACKAALNEDQGGLCAYCEKPLAPSDGQVDHIKPKSGTNAHPHLCFTYSNYAHSCINPKTCGQKKKSGLLPVEPAPGCNDEWQLSTDGSIQPLSGLTRARQHEVRQTRDMLGLNNDSNLVVEREKWLVRAIEILHQDPSDLPLFLQGAPYRYILAATL